jgi:hypothetical protein
MNMISTGSFLTEMDASNKQETLAEKFAAVWEKKNSKVARAGGVSLMALSLAACGSDDETADAGSGADTGTGTDTGTDAGTEAPTTPVVPVVTALVAGSDTTGTAGDDSFSGATASLTANTTLLGTDDISGGEGADTIALSLGANFGGFTVTGSDTGSMTGIETVELSAADTIARTFDATGVSGVETYKIDGTNAVVSITDSADLAAIELSNIASGAFSITYAAATGGTSPVAGTADTLNLSVAGLGSATADIAVTAAGVETLAITSNAAPTAAGTTNYLDVSAVSAATSTTVSGAANTDIAAVSTATTSFDASAATGDVTAALGNAAAGALTTIKTGAGADKVTAAYDDLTANATIDLGAGEDTLTLTGAATSVSQFVMSGVETLDVTSVTGGATTVSMVKSDGAASTIVAGLSKTDANVNYAGDLDFVGDSGAKNIDIIGAATGTITTDTTGAVDIDVSANAAATATSLNAGGGIVEANSASSLDVSITGNVDQTGAISAAKATSLTLTNAGAAQSAIAISAAKAETVSITTDKNMTLADGTTVVSGAKIVTIDTAGAFVQDDAAPAAAGGFAAAQTMTLSGAGSKASATFDSIVGATDLAYSQTITASGLKAGLTFGTGVDAGSGSLTVDVSDVTGAVDMSTMDAAGTVTYTASNLGANTLDQISGKNVVINATDAIGGVSYTGGATDISLGSTLTLNGPTVSATDVDVVGTATATSMTATVTGSIVADTYDFTPGAKTKTITISGDGGLGTDNYTVTLVDYDKNATDTVTVDLSGIVKDATTQSAVTINVEVEETNAMSLTGSKGNNDTVDFGTHTTVSDLDITLSGIEKVTFDDGAAFKAATLSGQTIALTGDGAGATASLVGTDAADTISTANLTEGANADLEITGGKGADTITLGAMTEVVFMSALATNGADTITGFTSASDQIDIAGTGKTYEQGADGTAPASAILDASSAVKVDVTATLYLDTAANDLGSGVIRVTDEAAADWSDAGTVIGAALTVDATAGNNAIQAIIVDNGTDTRIYHYEDVTNGFAAADDLTLLATVTGLEVDDFVVADFIMV